MLIIRTSLARQGFGLLLRFGDFFGCGSGRNVHGRSREKCVCDGGWKYLSTGAYTDDLDAAEAAAEKIIYF